MTSIRSEFLTYAEVMPHPSLREIVEHYRVTGAKRLEPFVFPDYSSIFQGLIFNIDPLDDILLEKKERIRLRYKVYFVGQAISPSVLYSSSLHLNLIAVNFHPTGVFQLTGLDLADFTDQIIDAEVLFGDAINALYEQVLAARDPWEAVRLIDYFLCLKASARKKQNSSCVLMSLSILNQGAGQTSIRALQELTNASLKTLQRSFRTEVGVTPKMYQRLLRFNQAKRYLELSRQGIEDWWEPVVRFGFYDHSHFISEFRFFSGQTPLQYLCNYRKLNLPVVPGASLVKS